MSMKVAHLQMVQAVINRMSVNSFLLKGWSVVLVSALFALGAAGERAEFGAVAIFPALAFWGLDGYFLRQERLFRALHDRIRNRDGDDADFSMDTAVVATEVASWPRVTVSITLLVFHGAVLASVAVVTYLLFCPPWA